MRRSPWRSPRPERTSWSRRAARPTSRTWPSECERAADRAIELPGDLRENITEQLAQAALDSFGRLDIWVNNAGGTDERGVRPLADTTDAQLRDMLELNLVAAFAGARAAAHRMARGGAIVNIASGAGMRAAPNTGAYAAAKAALINLTYTMAAELAPRASG